VGEAGAGQRLKLVANSWVATVLEGVAESLSFARDLGLDPELFLDAVKSLQAGGVSGVVRSGAGFHVLKVLT
jgi:3-hydroxyisobutyrate dehydrogenase-like beta-hydroxyacid dehydrogenase